MSPPFAFPRTIHGRGYDQSANRPRSWTVCSLVVTTNHKLSMAMSNSCNAPTGDGTSVIRD